MPIKGYNKMTLRFEGDDDWIEVKMDNDYTKLLCPKGFIRIK